MNLLVHSATGQNEKLAHWTFTPLVWVNNAALLSLDIISAPIKWLYIHAVTFLFSYKPSALGPHKFTHLEKHIWGPPSIDLIFNITFQWNTFFSKHKQEKNIPYYITFLLMKERMSCIIHKICKNWLGMILIMVEYTSKLKRANPPHPTPHSPTPIEEYETKSSEAKVNFMQGS